MRRWKQERVSADLVRHRLEVLGANVAVGRIESFAAKCIAYLPGGNVLYEGSDIEVAKTAVEQAIIDAERRMSCT